MRLTSLEVVAYLLWARLTLSKKNLPDFRGQSSHGTIEKSDRISRAELRRAVILGRRTMQVSQRLPFRCTCLVQSVALMAMLRRRSIPGQLRMGVNSSRVDNSQPFAHSWVECGGTVVLDTANNKDFVPFE